MNEQDRYEEQKNYEEEQAHLDSESTKAQADAEEAQRQGTNTEVSKLVEWTEGQVACSVLRRDCKCKVWKWGKSAICSTCTAKRILSNSKCPLALIDPMCTTTLSWTRVKADADMSCGYPDCTRGIKAGESYYQEEHLEGDEYEVFCLECASFFMSQKLSYIIPLAEELKEAEDGNSS